MKKFVSSAVFCVCALLGAQKKVVTYEAKNVGDRIAIVFTPRINFSQNQIEQELIKIGIIGQALSTFDQDDTVIMVGERTSKDLRNPAWNPASIARQVVEILKKHLPETEFAAEKPK